MIIVKIIKSHRDIVTICDLNLLGKKFEEGSFQLEVKESFFKGEEFSEEKAIKILQDIQREDATFNIVGENSIKAALKSKIISEKEVGKIQGIPFALILS